MTITFTNQEKTNATVAKNRPQINAKIINSTETIKKKRGNPKWHKGMPPLNPNGRQKGSPNKFSIQQYKQAAASGKLPLQFMLDVMRDEGKPDELRLSAATAAAPYLHRKMPIGIEQVPGRFGSLTADQIRQLSTPALQQLMQASQTYYQQLVQLGMAQPEGDVIDVVPT